MAGTQNSRKTRQFNFRRFITITLLFGGVAALMLYNRASEEKGPVNLQPFPLYDLIIEGRVAKGSIILNDISIGRYELAEKTRQATIALTPWLKNGANILALTTSAPDPKESPAVTARLRIYQPDGKEVTEPLFNFTKPSADRKTLTAKGLPTWSFLQGKATFHDEGEIRSAVKELHQAYAARNLNKITSYEAPLFKDLERITGRSKLADRQYRKEIILKGRVEPLKPLIIIPFANGRVMRVTNQDGEAPIRVYFNYGNGGKAILTGKFWSKINGQWQVVR